MRTQPRALRAPSPARGESPPRWRARAVRAAAYAGAPGLVCLAGLAVAAFFLAIYPVKGYSMPIGWDTPAYLAHTNFVAEQGVADVPDTLPPPIKVLPGRAAFPLVVLPLSALFGLSTFKLAAAAPAAAAVGVALAAGGLVSYALRGTVWDATAVAVVVGVSPVVIRLMAPETYTDNLFAAALFTAALVPILSLVGGARGFAAAILLLTAAGLANSLFFSVIIPVLAVVALAYAPSSWRAWRKHGSPLFSTPTPRLAAVIGGALALTSVGIFGVLRAVPGFTRISPPEILKKFRQDIGLHRFAVTLPLAAFGAAAVARMSVLDESDAVSRRSARFSRPFDTARSRPRFLLLAFGAWTAVSLVGVLAFVGGVDVPAHRLLAFLLPLPILAAVGVLALGRLSARHSRALVGVGLISLVVASLCYLGYRSFYETLPQQRGIEWLKREKVQDAATAAAYLDAVNIAPTEPVVFVIDDTGTNPLSDAPQMAYMIRAVLPAARAEAAHFYLGNPERYLAGRPTHRARPKTYNAIADSFWRGTRRLLPRRPVALVLSSFNPLYAEVATEQPGRVVAPNVLALHGPLPSSPVTPPPIPSGPQGVAQTAALGVATLVVLTLVGLGWCAALLPRDVRPFELVALCPSFGIAFLILGGFVADTAGVRLVGVAGTATLILVGLAGWAAAGARIRSRGIDGKLRFGTACA